MLTSYIKHLAVNVLSSVSARIKSTCNLIGQCFEMPNVSYTQPIAPALDLNVGLVLREYVKLLIKQNF